jgi:hypothetical protein
VALLLRNTQAFTFKTTVSVLEQVFPEKKIKIVDQPSPQMTQTHLFGDRSLKPGEIDLILTGKYEK